MQPFNLSVIALAAMLGTPALAQNTQNQTQQGQPEGADIQVQQPAPEVQVQQPAPQVTVEQPAPQVTVEQPKPNVTVEQAKPDITVEQAKPDVTVEQQGQANVEVTQPGQADVQIEQQDQAQQDRAQSVTPAGAEDGSVTGTSQTGANNNPIYGMTGQELIGQTIYGSNGEEIGEVDNVVIGRSGGRDPAAVIGVGGFLGLGERNVAIPLSELNMRDDRLSTSLTREQIGDMEAYDQSSWDSWDQNRPFNEAMNR